MKVHLSSFGSLLPSMEGVSLEQHLGPKQAEGNDLFAEV